MHRQRSPFTGGPGGFGSSPFHFNASQFGEGTGTVFPPVSDGLNGMPYMAQPPIIKPIMRSISRQRQLAEDGNLLDSLPPLPTMSQRLLSSSGVVGRGQVGTGSSVPTALAPYEGDIGIVKDTAKEGSKSRPDPSFDSEKLLKLVTGNGQIADPETDEEAAQCLQLGANDLPREPRWRTVLDCVVDSVPEEHRSRWEASMHRYSQTAIARHMMIVLQFLAMLANGAVNLAVRLRGLMGPCRLGMWRTKFQLRSTMRQMLWRMANVKANDTLVFLVVVVVTPWLFLISLVGFAFSFVFSIKIVLAEGVHQLRMRMG